MTVNYNITCRYVGSDAAVVTATGANGETYANFAYIQHCSSEEPELVLYRPVEFSTILRIIAWHRPDMIWDAFENMNKDENIR